MTIAAISTAPGTGGIAVIRVSGPQAVAIVDSIFQPLRASHTLASRPAHTLTYGQVVQDSGEVLDEVVAALFRGPHSFTGEDVVELSCHGSTYIQQTLLRLLLDHGCRLAEPGEFTRRAFANGRMDLTQAEAVADLIAAGSEAAHRVALSQMKGRFSTRLGELRQQLVDLASLLELELDFSEEEVEFADREKLTQLAEEIHTALRSLIQSFSTGNALRSGIPVAIIGETNAGKSTLLNLLLGDDKAIVSDIHGTTRDVVEDTCILNGVLLRFVDTAGIRETHDRIEALGIERTYRRLDGARIVLWVVDGTRLGDAALTEDLLQDLRALHARIAPYLHESQTLCVVINKSDLIPAALLERQLPALRAALDEMLPTATDKSHSAGVAAARPAYTLLPLSAKTQAGFPALLDLLKEATTLPAVHSGDVIVTNLRHYEALVHADEAILRVRTGLQSLLSGDLVAQDLRECNYFLGTILGTVSSAEVLQSIFSKFCIGK
jgi:tRNA modification GTPase